jgi:hypothetical protein
MPAGPGAASAQGCPRAEYWPSSCWHSFSRETPLFEVWNGLNKQCVYIFMFGSQGGVLAVILLALFSRETLLFEVWKGLHKHCVYIFMFGSQGGVLAVILLALSSRANPPSAVQGWTRESNAMCVPGHVSVEMCGMCACMVFCHCACAHVCICVCVSVWICKVTHALASCPRIGCKYTALFPYTHACPRSLQNHYSYTLSLGGSVVPTWPSNLHATVTSKSPSQSSVTWDSHHDLHLHGTP